MDPWSEWDAARVVVALTAVWWVGIWVQLTLFHWAGGFKKRAMWGPVLVTPLLAGTTAIGAIARDGVLGWIAAGALGLGVVEGLVGLLYHLRGIARQVGGVSLRNILSGPPPVLPVAYSLIGVVGLAGLTWGAT